MRIVLIYPPPWKIPPFGDAPFHSGQAAPASAPTGAIGGDFLRAPYGLLSIAAQALRAGHRVTVLNLSNACWAKVERCIRHRPADLFGLSCFTANRRGVAMTADLIRRTYPRAHVVVGGPHATALPMALLHHHPAVDTVIIGEGEITFMALVNRLICRGTAEAVPGTAWRSGATVQMALSRPAMETLDRLVSPLEYFNLRTILTSRGCPGRCTFCSSRLMWGPQVRFHSVDYVLEMLECAVKRYGHRIIAIKDDTFTVCRQRVLAICQEICRRGLRFEWSCETRADYLDERLLKAMRLAGCKRISMGVESAAAPILENIRKKITPGTVLEATRLAKRFGLQVRFYMMVGNRGETYDTFRESLDFIDKAKPHQFVFSQLHLYPGTEEFEIFNQQGAVTPEIFFDRDMMFLTCFAGKQVDADRIGRELAKISGVQEQWQYDIADCHAILKRLPQSPSAHMDMCAACVRAGLLEQAQYHLDKASEKHYPLLGLIYNLAACIAARKKGFAAVEAYLEKALACYPHQIVIDNIRRFAEWQSRGGPAEDTLPDLLPNNGFETSCLFHHPEFPEPDAVLDAA